MRRIFWDTMLFIYWLEDHPKYAPMVEKIHREMEARKDVLCTSIFTLGEILVGPYRMGATAEVKRIRDYLESPAVELLPFSTKAADQYARLRAQHRVSPADGIQLACAAAQGIDLFITHDDALRKLNVPGIPFIAGMDGRVFP